jgi:hypothetical protein
MHTNHRPSVFPHGLALRKWQILSTHDTQELSDVLPARSRGEFFSHVALARTALDGAAIAVRLNIGSYAGVIGRK